MGRVPQFCFRAGLCLFLGAVVTPALARPWRDVEPGVSTREDVTRLFGEPRLVQKKGRDILVYTGKTAISGTQQVQFRLEPGSNVVSRIDVYPAARIDRSSIADTYGPSCAQVTRRDKPCFVEKVSEDLRTYLLYGQDGLAVFLLGDGLAVQSLTFLPSSRTGTPPPTEPAAATAPTVPAPPTEPKPSDDRPTSPAVSTAPEAPADSSPTPSAEGDWGVSASFGEPTEKPPSERSVEFGGQLNTVVHGYPRPAPPEKVAGRASVDLLLTGKVKTGQVRASGTLLGRRDFVDALRNRFDVHEAVAAVDGTRFQLSAGRLLVAWGTANLTNPTDILNPLDRTDFIATEKRAAWMLNARAVLGPVLAEAYYLPVAEPHLLPPITGVDDSGALLSPSPWVTGSLPQDGPLPLRYVVGEDRVPRPSMDHFQAAGRISLSVLQADVHLGYGYLYDRLPSLRTEVDPSTAPDFLTVTVHREYPRLHWATLDFERTFGKLRVAAEAALTRLDRPQAEDIERSYVTYVVGCDFETPNFLDEHRVRLFAEFTDTRPLQKGLRTDFLGQLRYPLQKVVLLRASYQARSDWSIDLTAVSFVQRLDYLVTARATVSFADTVKLRLGGSLPGGSQGFFAKYASNARLEASAEAVF